MNQESESEPEIGVNESGQEEDPATSDEESSLNDQLSMIGEAGSDEFNSAISEAEDEEGYRGFGDLDLPHASSQDSSLRKETHRTPGRRTTSTSWSSLPPGPDIVRPTRKLDVHEDDYEKESEVALTSHDGFHLQVRHGWRGV